MKISMFSLTGLLYGLTAICASAIPTISLISTQRTFPTLPTHPISFVVGDDQASATNLILTGVSSNLSLVADSNIVFGGFGSNRTVTITPSGVEGTNWITITVQDPLGSNTMETFPLIIAGFTDIGANLVPLDDASVAWGDYDNDGHLDLLVTGQNTNTPYGSGGETAKIYHNNGDDTFSDIGASLTGIDGGEAHWGDYNNDGRLDILLAGLSSVGATGGGSFYLAIYRNDGSNIFTSVFSPQLGGFGGGSLTGTITRWFSCAWGDYDNDGKLDAVYTGGFVGGLFRNNGSDSFVGAGTNISLGSPDSTLTWVDYNNDGNLDLAYTPGNFYSTIPTTPGVIYQNQGDGNFTLLTNALPALSQGSVAWEDYNNNGIFDVAIVGNETNTVLVGNGEGSFTNLPITLPGGGLSSVAWGDFDNDGLPDLVVSSYSGTRIFHNNGDGTFTDMGISLPKAGNGGVAVGDFNNDGCLDIAIVGNGVTKIFRNDGAMPGPPPVAPTHLSVTMTTNEAIFSWSPVTNSIQSGGFSYNLRVGTTPGGIDVVGPMADPATGFRQVPAVGNAGLVTSRTLTHLKAGTYYWSVQSINHAYIGSPFAPEQSFTLVSPFIISQPPSQTNLIGATISLTVTNGGTAPLYYQWYFNGNPLSDGGQFNGSTTPSLTISNIQNYNIGGYQLLIGNAVGVVTSAVAWLTVTNYAPAVRYVNLNNPNPAYPYEDWSTAATNIQDAMDAAFDGDVILVTNGIYRSTGLTVSGSPTSLFVNRAVVVRSVNGPSVTSIDGGGVARCVYLTNDAALSGFTLTNGNAGTGGGVYCESTNNDVVSNCVISACTASSQGGGAYQGTLVHCTFANNSCQYGNGGGASSAILSYCKLANNSCPIYSNGNGGGAASSVLNFCTLVTNSAPSGGGAYLGVLNNCIVIGNISTGIQGGGGGTYNSTVFNSALADNSTVNNEQTGTYGGFGGGAYGGSLVNCTITGNRASIGGGVANCNPVKNCIIYDNSFFTNALFFPQGPSNYYNTYLDYSCTMPLPTGGTGNITNEPLLASIYHISLNSPCRAAGDASVTTGVDIDGEPWADPPSIGCDEVYPGNVNGNIIVAIGTPYTNAAPGFPYNFEADISGPITASTWNFGDGTVVTNEAYAAHIWAAVGDYPVVLTAYNDTYPDGISATDIIHVAIPKVLYVSLYNQNPVAPYDTWAKAATTIQDAIDAASAGALILVTNGPGPPYYETNGPTVYQTGGRAIHGPLMNRVAIDKPVTVESVNGPSVTIIAGNPVGNNAARCVYMTNGAALVGFTLSDGLANIGGLGSSAGDDNTGGGIWSESTNVIVTNCIVKDCSAVDGAGVYSATLYDCTISNNGQNMCFDGGGAYLSTLHDCTLAGNAANYGGGADGSTLFNCTIVSNSASSSGGGAWGGTLTNCTLLGNFANYGGGAAGGAGVPIILDNCIISSNTASQGGGVYVPYSSSANFYTNCILNNCVLAFNSASAAGRGGGAYFAQLNNCIISNNSALPYGYGGGVEGGWLNNCILTGNTAQGGGGADGYYLPTILNNCTLAGNIATNGTGGGASFCTLNNCIVYGNTNTSGQTATANWTGGNLSNSCTIPMPPGGGNITNDPTFVNLAGGDFHLQSQSPCINSGNNSYVASATDLDGNPRIVGGTVDMGAYEYQTPASVISYAWLQQYGLPTDGTVDYADLDGTPFNVYQDWIAGLNPTNALSVLSMLPPVPTNNPAGLVVSWQSVSNRTYFLQSSTNLSAQPAFSTIQSNIVGQPDITSFMDTNAVGKGPFFYRVGVQE